MISPITPPPPAAAKDLLTLTELTGDEILSLLATAESLRRNPGRESQLLAGKSVVLLFEKPSLRTRITFELGAQRLGGTALYMDHAPSRIGERETVADYARNLSLWCDAIVARVFDHAVIEELAAEATVPVINALSDIHHPCQALADLLTMRQNFGDLEGLKAAYIGDGNNVCNSLLLAAAAVGMDLTIICPVGYEPDPGVRAAARALARESGADIMITDEIGAVYGRRVVYTDTWVSMGQEADAAERGAAFEGYQVDDAVMAMAADDAIFMHCLPAHRGVEVAASVIDGPQSVVLQQAANRMHAQNALLATLLADAPAKALPTPTTLVTNAIHEGAA
jgi:ornithine carbamoyltransferase